MFRRAKLRFADVPPATLASAVAGGTLEARLALSDARGEPLCATVRPPLVDWSVSPG